MTFDTLIAQWGYLAVGLGTFFEGETVLLVAGAMAHRGLLSLPLVMFAAFVGSVAGDQLWFLLGRRYGRTFIAKRPRLAAHAGRVESGLKRYGTPFVLGFRFLYGLRTVTPVLLGASAYPVQRFMILNVVGAAVWALVFGLLGFTVGTGLSHLLGRGTRVEEAVAVALVLALVLWLCVRHWRRRTLLAATPPSEPA